MCELFPIFHSCCGIPVRIGLVFIAILSIVTGAMINAGLKKAGVNISNIDDVKDLHKKSFSLDTNATLETSDVEIVTPNETDVNNVILVKPKRTKRTTITTTAKLIRAGGNQSTVEILDEDTTVPSPDEDQGMNTEAIPFDNWKDSEPEKSEESEDTEEVTTRRTTRTTTTQTTTRSTTTTRPTTTSDLIRKVSSVNRNGINLMACAFVALGILLLAANFANSAELGLLYVVLSLATSAAALCLLVGTVSECAKAQQTCLLSKMDWFSAFLLTLFWFMYIFLWVFFAGVANAFANGLQRPMM